MPTLTTTLVHRAALAVAATVVTADGGLQVAGLLEAAETLWDLLRSPVGRAVTLAATVYIGVRLGRMHDDSR